MKQTKKIISIFASLLMILVFTFAYFTGNAEQKSKVSQTASMASVGILGISGNNNSGASRRARIYNKLKAAFAPEGFNVIADSYIRVEQVLVNGKAEYLFDHKKIGNESPTENKLNEQDLFRATDLGIFLMAESKTKTGNGLLQTYPNPFVFADIAGALQNADLETVYNGRMVFKTGDTTYLPDLPILDCRVCRTAQQTATTNRSERLPSDGYLPLMPGYTLRGRENNNMSLVIPANANTLVQTDNAATYISKVVLILRGFKVTGAGNVKFADDKFKNLI